MSALGSYVGAVAAGFAAGSVPFAWLVARARGVDIFAVGSGNPGATNVWRSVGAGPGALVFLLDALKGAVPAWGAGWVAGGAGGASPWGVQLAALAGAVAGHSFSPWLRFRGGKGIATGAGGVLVLLPGPGLVALGVFALVVGLTRYVSLASLLAAGSLPLTAWAWGRPPGLVAACAVLAAFAVWRHRANIGRLLAGTEARIGRGGARRAPAVAPPPSPPSQAQP